VLGTAIAPVLVAATLVLAGCATNGGAKSVSTADCPDVPGTGKFAPANMRFPGVRGWCSHTSPIAIGVGSDPTPSIVSVSTITTGDGPEISLTAGTKIRYRAQTWDGKTALHDSWQLSSSSDTLDDSEVSQSIERELLAGPAGSVEELAYPPGESPFHVAQAVVVVVAYAPDSVPATPASSSS
jgi:hypothetical protein